VSFCVAILLSLMSWATVFADTNTLRTDAWCPYSCDPKSDHPGILAEIVSAAFARAGHDVDYQVTGWARSIKAVREGKANVLLGA
jgi:polar amino acid transport system substrate-binding protein